MPLLAYQTGWNTDPARIKVWEKSRRIGASFGDAAESALLAAANMDAGGMNTYYMGTNKDMTSQYIKDVVLWAKKFNLAAGEMEEEIEILPDRDKTAITIFKVRFATGFEVVGLPSKALAFRSKQGRVVLDEAAFMENFKAILAAAKALTMLGGTIGILSTHNGEDNDFNQLVLDIRAGKLPYSLHRTTLHDALDDGYYEHVVCPKRRIEPSREGREQWYRETLADFGDDADEELFCIPSQGTGTALPRTLIIRCMSEDIPVIRLFRKPAFTYESEEVRSGDIEGFCEEFLLPHLEQLDPKRTSSFGQDFARSGDLSVLIPLQEEQNTTRRAPFVLEMAGIPFEQQKQVLFYVVDRLPCFNHGALDARGNGQYLAEVAAQKYGPECISEVMLTEGWYREHMPRYKAAFEDQSIMLPQDADILDDHRALKQVKGVIRLPEGKTNKDGQQRHGDSAIAGALAFYASEQDGGPLGDFHIGAALETAQLMEGF